MSNQAAAMEKAVAIAESEERHHVNRPMVVGAAPLAPRSLSFAPFLARVVLLLIWWRLLWGGNVNSCGWWYEQWG